MVEADGRFDNELYNPQGKKKTAWYNIFFAVLAGIVIVVCVCVIVFNIVFIRVQIIGVSMEPTYNANLAVQSGFDADAYYENSPYKDTAYVNRFDKGSRGGIVVLYNADAGKNIIKRIIAVGGDTINIEPFLNTQTGKYEYYVCLGKGGAAAEQLDENYIFKNDTPVYCNDLGVPDSSGDNDNTNGMYTCYLNFCKLKVNTPSGLQAQPDGSLLILTGYVFVLGDNRAHSEDSSIKGPFAVGSIVGAVSFCVPYNQNFLGYWWGRVFGG